MTDSTLGFVAHQFVIVGHPVGKGRPRFVRTTGNAYTPAKTRSWEADAKAVFSQHYRGAPADEPLSVIVTAVFARPKRLMRAKDPNHRIPHTGKPDGDNILKAVGDALEAAGVVRNDSIINVATVSKWYAAKDEGPSVEVLIKSDKDRWPW